MAQWAGSTLTPTMDTTCRTGEEEEKNHAVRPMVIVNFDQLMNEVEATPKNVFSCTDNNMLGTYLYLDSSTISTLQILYQDLQSRLWGLVAYVQRNECTV
jgi:hypothetical protein